jgi:hypothetical protein
MITTYMIPAVALQRNAGRQAGIIVYRQKFSRVAPGGAE